MDFHEEWKDDYESTSMTNKTGGFNVASQGLSNNLNQSISHIGTYFFKIHCNIVLPFTPRPFWRFLSCSFIYSDFESTPTFFYFDYMPCPSQSSRLNHPDYIRWTVQTVKLFASLLVPNIRLRILFSNTLSLRSSLNVRDHASHPYSTNGNLIVLYILIF